MDSRIMPYIVVRHKAHGNQFITSYSGNYNDFHEYEILGFADSIPKAQKILHPTKEHRDNALTDWMNKTFKDMEVKGLPISEEGKKECLNIVLKARD